MRHGFRRLHDGRWRVFNPDDPDRFQRIDGALLRAADFRRQKNELVQFVGEPLQSVGVVSRGVDWIQARRDDSGSGCWRVNLGPVTVRLRCTAWALLDPIGLWVRREEVVPHRDFQRAKVYAAEEIFSVAGGPDRRLVDLQACREWAHDFAADTATRLPSFEIGETRSRRLAGICRGPGKDGLWKICLKQKWFRPWVIVHELAHTLAADDHGPVFCREYVRLVRLAFGNVWADNLKDEFEARGVVIATELEEGSENA